MSLEYYLVFETHVPRKYFPAGESAAEKSEVPASVAHLMLHMKLDWVENVFIFNRNPLFQSFTRMAQGHVGSK